MEKKNQPDVVRGHINTIILSTLCDGDKYGYEIGKEIEAKTRGQYKLKEPTLYSSLKRLEKQGMISAYYGEEEKTGGGRRKYYTLTEKGREIGEKSLTQWEYSRTLIDKLISEREYDLDSAPPEFDFADKFPSPPRSDEPRTRSPLPPLTRPEPEKAEEGPAFPRQSAAPAEPEILRGASEAAGAAEKTAKEPEAPIPIETPAPVQPVSVQPPEPIVLRLTVETPPEVRVSPGPTTPSAPEPAPAAPVPPPKPVRPEAEERTFNNFDLDAMPKPVSTFTETREQLEQYIRKNEPQPEPEPYYAEEPQMTEAERTYKSRINKLFQSAKASSVREITEEDERPSAAPPPAQPPAQVPEKDYSLLPHEKGLSFEPDLSEDGLREDFRIKVYQPNLARNYKQQVYKNRLLCATLWLLYACMVLELLLVYLFAESTIRLGLPVYGYIAAVLLVFPVAGTVLFLAAPNYRASAKRRSSEWMINALLMFVFFALAVLAVNLVAKTVFNNPPQLITYVILPILLAFDLVLGTGLYILLHRSGRFYV